MTLPRIAVMFAGTVPLTVVTDFHGANVPILSSRRIWSAPGCATRAALAVLSTPARLILNDIDAPGPARATRATSCDG